VRICKESHDDRSEGFELPGQRGNAIIGGNEVLCHNVLAGDISECIRCRQSYRDGGKFSVLQKAKRQDSQIVTNDCHRALKQSTMQSLGMVGIQKVVDLIGWGRFALMKPKVVFDGKYFSHLRSEEHTSELQSRENLVCRLLLE